MSIEKLIVGTQATVLNTGAQLTNNSLAIGSAFNNLVGGGSGDGYPRCRITFSGTWGTAPTANTGLSLWFITSEDGGSVYEDGDASTTPSRGPDVVIPARAVNTAQVIARESRLPVGFFKVLAKNDGTGQTLNSGWTVALLPLTSSFVA